MTFTMKKITKVWFDGEWLYGRGDDKLVYRQSLLWYKQLMNASDDERKQFEISTIGIHWPGLGVDVSFESFLYEEAEPSPMQRFFLTHPEINISAFASRAGINATLLRNYINGFKKPSPERVSQIQRAVRNLGEELCVASFSVPEPDGECKDGGA